jgi:RNA polymerase sigma-70 factor, ECF subfamily
MARPPDTRDTSGSPGGRPQTAGGASGADVGNGRRNAAESESSAPAPKPHVPPRAVNIPAISPSDQKQIRVREAEVDRALIAKAQAGDMAAFRSLVERHQRRAFSIALSLVRDENDARELVQDAFLRVFKGLGSFQGGSSFFTWLYRIITNLSIDLIRKPGRQGGGDLDDKRLEAEDAQEPDFALLSRIDGADPAEVVRRREIAARLQVALDALPSYHRGVIVMREIEGLSYEEMAQVMGVSKGTIMSRLFHARQKLQRALVDCYKEQVGPNAPGRMGAEAEDDSGEPSSKEGGESP